MKKTGKKLKKDDPEQSQRFVDTAKTLESDESGRKFSKTLKKIAEKTQDNTKT